MGVVPFSTSPPHPLVVFDPDHFDSNGAAVPIIKPDMQQFTDIETNCNASYDLRVGDKNKDHRRDVIHALKEGECIELLPGNAVIIETEEDIQFRRRVFVQILSRVSLLVLAIANTPSKIDPGIVATF